MAQELTILKLGGSLLTDKTKPYTYREEVLKSVAREIRECLDEGLIQSLILIHGVGSYGHPPVLEHKLHKGFLGPEQLMPLSRTQREVADFRHIIWDELQKAEIPVCLMFSSSMITSVKMKMTSYFFESLKGFADVGMVPLTGGDILVDSAMGWSVGSGDQMAVIIAKELGAKRLIFASDVAGIYEADPKVTLNPPLIERVNLDEIDMVLERMGSSGVVDASGAMKGKLTAIAPAKPLIEKGLEVTLISMMEYGNLKGILKGEETPSTQIVVE